MTTTKAYRMNTPGSDIPFRLVEETVPAPGRGEVLVRVRASSLNYRDPALASGHYPYPMEPERVALADGAGEIAGVGPEARRFNVGDRVASSFFPTWYGGAYRQVPEMYVTTRDGWLTEYKVVDEDALVAIPDHLTFEEAAALPCALVTAWSALKGVGVGDIVLTQGTGGVALFAVQLAQALGARVVATTSDPAKVPLLEKLGAHAVTGPEWAADVLAATGGHGADLVVDMGGESTIAQSIAALAYRGTISQVGLLGAAGAGLDLAAFFGRQAILRSIPVGSRSDLEDALRVVAAREIHPVIDRVFDFGDAAAAWAHFSAPGRVGKVVIRH
ncbi:zinc-dependent alcohol dehydrogenase family protein [Herbidospora sp. RD11066]